MKVMLGSEFPASEVVKPEVIGLLVGQVMALRVLSHGQKRFFRKGKS